MAAPALAVSLLLPAADDVATTLRSLQAIARLPDAPAFEVVVVVAARDTATRALTAGLAGDVRVVIDEDAAGFGDACDKAARQASADAYILLTAAAVPADGWLDDLLAALDGRDAALPRSLTADGAELPASAWLALAITADAYNKVGGFAGTRQPGRGEKETLVDAVRAGGGSVATARAAVLLA